jgi:hypothetical protein
LEKFHEWKLHPYRDIVVFDGVNDGDTGGGGEEEGEEVAGEAVLVPSILLQYEGELGSNNNEDVKM